MAVPNSARLATHSLERELKENMVRTCEAEQRSKLLMTLLRLGLLTKEVKNFMMKQLKQRRGQKSRGGGKVIKYGNQRMAEKLADSRADEDKLRKERDTLRVRLEDELENKNVYNRIMKSLKAKVVRIRLDIKVKNKNKITKYMEEKEDEDLAELSSLREELGEFGNLKIFNGITIQPEERKPPVSSKEVVMSKDELEILSKNPKFAVRALMNKERFMVEYEKGLCKKKYSDIGKEVVEGKVVEEEPIDEEDKRIMKEAAWQERKSELVYDFESKNLDFGRQKATGMKRNKRVKLPKADSIQLEAFLEVRRKRAAQLYDLCVKKLGEDCEKGMDNLTAGEKRGLRSLKKRVASGELIVCQTDKSGRFCVLTRSQYLEAGLEHTKKDRKISQEDHEEIQRAVNGHMRWWGTIWCLGSNWSQEARCLSNLLNHGLGVCPMTLLIKDHKSWSVVPKTRSVMGGNEGGNSGISEFISLVLEPVAREQAGNMEINATNGLLADIEDLNEGRCVQPCGGSVG